MRQRHLRGVSGLLLASVASLDGPVLSAQDRAPAPMVTLETSAGDITIELDAERAPETVANFLAYVDVGFFDGLIFHRVIPDRLIQTGWITAGFHARIPIHAPIANEATNGLTNDRGTVAMARTPDPQSAQAQFFINVERNRSFDHAGPTRRGWGYAVFGLVRDGLDVVDRIARARTTRRGDLRDLPVEPVVIYAAFRVSAPAPR